MARSRRKQMIFTNLEIVDAGSEGKAIARNNEKVVFVPFVVPGDEIDVKITKKRRNYLEGRAIQFHRYSNKRVDPDCEHFGLCGGCKWQNMAYKHQLYYKEKQVKDNLERIGKISTSEINGIIPSENIFYYRNKLEFTFSDKKWLEVIDDSIKPEERKNALGFHLPGWFDKILDINKCHLQNDPSNQIRNSIKDYSVKNGYTFFNVKTQEGLLRNLVIRNTSTGEIMIIVVFNQRDEEKINALLQYVKNEFPEIISLMYVVNRKKNDSISDQKIELFSGRPYIIEEMKITENQHLKFKIGPVSFFQTNSKQAEKLYSIARNFASLSGNETVYDLYTGTGTIANYISSEAKKVIGIEYIPSAIEDAKENSDINNIKNTAFFSGDIINVLDEYFVTEHGKPEVIVTDPPRAGMHQKVVEKILALSPLKIVYISCNPSTQARDILLMSRDYHVSKIQPVDMFPHTSHVENIVLLERK